MKNILPILFIFILSSCEKQKAKNTINNEQLVKQYFEHFNNHKWTKMANMYAETADFKDPSLGPGIVKQTRQQTIDKYNELSKIFPNLHDEVIRIYPSGDNHVIIEFLSNGTALDKTKFELPICTILTIENGLIIKDFTYFDNFDEEKNK